MLPNISSTEVLLRKANHDEAYGLCKIIAAGTIAGEKLGNLGFINLQDLLTDLESKTVRVTEDYIIIDITTFEEFK